MLQFIQRKLTASGDCLSCSDTDEICMKLAHKEYRKRIRAFHKSRKGMDWMDAQIKRIEHGHQDMWGHDREVIRAELKCTLADDHTSFEMRQMTTRTDQLIHIAEVTGSKIYTRESEVGAQGLAKALILSLKQFHTQSYMFYEKRPAKDLVGLKGLHSSDAFWCLNMLTSVGPKSFCPWHFKFRGITKVIVTSGRCNTGWP